MSTIAAKESREDVCVARTEKGVKANRWRTTRRRGPGTVPVRMPLRNGSCSRYLSFSGTGGPGTRGTRVQGGRNQNVPRAALRASTGQERRNPMLLSICS